MRKKLLQVLISLGKKRKKKASFIIPTMNYYPINISLRDPDFTCHILYHLYQQQYWQHSILRVVLNISTMVLRARLIRVQPQHPIRQFGLTIHSKKSLVKSSDKIKQKTEKPCNENPSLKSTDLRHIQKFIAS